MSIWDPAYTTEEEAGARDAPRNEVDCLPSPSWELPSLEPPNWRASYRNLPPGFRSCEDLSTNWLHPLLVWCCLQKLPGRRVWRNLEWELGKHQQPQRAASQSHQSHWYPLHTGSCLPEAYHEVQRKLASGRGNDSRRRRQKSHLRLPTPVQDDLTVDPGAARRALHRKPGPRIATEI